MIVLIGISTVLTVACAALARSAVVQQRRAKRARTQATLDELPGWVDHLLLRYAPGACLVVASNDGPGFLQLAVTGREAEWRQVEFGLPEAEWSRESFALAVLTLEEGADAFVEHNEENAEVPRFLHITLSGQRADVAERACDLLRRAAGVLSFPVDGTFTVSLDGGDHPEYYRSMADKAEHSDLPQWLVRRISAFFRQQAEELERAT